MKINFEKMNLVSKKASPEELKYIEQVGLAGIFENFLVAGINSIYQGQMPMVQGKVLGRLIKKLDSGESEIPLEQSEVELIKKVFLSDEAKFDAKAYVVVLEIANYFESLLYSKDSSEVIDLDVELE